MCKGSFLKGQKVVIFSFASLVARANGKFEVIAAGVDRWWYFPVHGLPSGADVQRWINRFAVAVGGPAREIDLAHEILVETAHVVRGVSGCVSRDRTEF